MKDFDSERERRSHGDRRFLIGGHEFAFKASVQQEIVDGYYDALSDPDVPNSLMLGRMDELVLASLEPEHEDAWRAARSADASSPLMAKDIHDVIEHMLGVMAGRPTESPSGSGSTPENDGQSSTEKSPSQEEATSAA